MTRYPKQGKGRRWTVLELKSVTADWRADTLSDGEGLSGEVRVSLEGEVSIRWKYAFKWERKVCWFQAGTWPSSSLDEIRRNRDDARDRLREGINPNAHKQAERIEAQREVEAVIQEDAARQMHDLTFKHMFEAWLTDGVARADGNAELRRSFDKDVLPRLDNMPVRMVTEQDLLKVLRAVVEERGVNRTAVLLCRDLQQMFRWAEKRKPWRALLAEGNPAGLLNVRSFVAKTYDTRNTRQRWLRPAEIQELAGLFADGEAAYDAAKPGEKYGVARPFKKTSQLATWICLSTLSRIGETLRAEWKHVDFKNATWFIPKENTKGEADAKNDLTVYLSPFSLRQFKELKKLTGKTRWLFPAKESDEVHVHVKSVSKQVGDRQTRFKKGKVQLKGRRRDDSLVLASGANGKWTEHDLRRTGATMMQQLKVHRDVIDLCQNHVITTKVQRAYQQHDYLEEMASAWRVLGDKLDSVMAEAQAARVGGRRPPLPEHLALEVLPELAAAA